MQQDGQSGEIGGDAASPGLERELQRLYRAKGGIGMDPAAAERVRLGLDAEWERVMRGRGRGSGRRRVRVWVRAAAAVGVAAAAVIGLVVVVGLPVGGGKFGRVQGPMAARGPDGEGAPLALADSAGERIRGDVDGSGGVDIVDAFVLARAVAEVEGERGLGPLWDVTGDGVVDEGDVDAVAMRAVRLEGADREVAGGAG